MSPVPSQSTLRILRWSVSSTRHRYRGPKPVALNSPTRLPKSLSSLIPGRGRSTIPACLYLSYASPGAVSRRAPCGHVEERGSGAAALPSRHSAASGGHPGEECGEKGLPSPVRYHHLIHERIPAVRRERAQYFLLEPCQPMPAVAQSFLNARVYSRYATRPTPSVCTLQALSSHRPRGAYTAPRSTGQLSAAGSCLTRWHGGCLAAWMSGTVPTPRRCGIAR